MGKSSLTKTEVAAKFASGIHCGQCTLGQWADRLGYDEDELYAMSASLGGGMFRGDTCGAVTGAMIAIGLAYGGDSGSETITKQKVKQFQDAFIARFGSTACRELLGYDFSVPGEEEKARSSGRMAEFCPGAVVAALEILYDILQDT